MVSSQVEEGQIHQAGVEDLAIMVAQGKENGRLVERNLEVDASMARLVVVVVAAAAVEEEEEEAEEYHKWGSVGRSAAIELVAVVFDSF